MVVFLACIAIAALNAIFVVPNQALVFMSIVIGCSILAVVLTFRREMPERPGAWGMAWLLILMALAATLIYVFFARGSSVSP